MHAPFHASTESPIASLLAVSRLWLTLKIWLLPPVVQEPGCSQQYTALCQQLHRATRLFWLASAVVLGGTAALVATGVLP